MPQESTATAATLAARTERVYACHILAIEGLPYLWTDDSTSELLGSGAASWMGATEANVLGWTVGQRTMLPGLRLPASFHEGIDPKLGTLQSGSTSIRLVDYSGIIADLFATEGKDFDILAQDIQPGRSDLVNSIGVTGGLTTTTWGKWIGLERIGPAGERAYFPAIPNLLVGYHHRANALGESEAGPRPITISTSPLDFQGRMVSVYRILRRDMPFPGTYADWPTWDDQASVEGSLVFLGKLLDRGAIRGNREWEIRCDGRASYTKRTLNQYAPGWLPITDAPIELQDDQTWVAISTYHRAASGQDRGIRFRDVFSLTGDSDTWRAQINDILADVVAGTVSDYGSTNLVDNGNAQARFQDDGSFLIQRDAQDFIIATPDGGVGVRLCMHEQIWRAFGFDPPLQAYDGSPLTEETQIRMVPQNAGDNIQNDEDGVGTNVPGDGYWHATLDSVAVGIDGVISSYAFAGEDNYGQPRLYRPVNAGNPLILRGPASTPQVVRLPFDQGYLETTPTVQWSDAEIDNSAVDSARYFAIRGKIAIGTPVGPGEVAVDTNGQVIELDNVEAKDYAVAVKASWLASTYGSVVEEDGRASLAIDRYEDPRLFGLPFAPLASEWSALATTSNPGLEIAPLFTIGYGQAGALGTALQCFCQLLFSTGSCVGWDGDSTTNPDFVAGQNDPGAAEPWTGDVLKADQGLGIPRQLVAEPDDMAAEFDRVPGGKDGALSRLGLAYVGPQESGTILESILRPRGLSWALDRGLFGVVYLAPFSPDAATVTIAESDLAGDPRNPSSVVPTQELRAVGAMDKCVLAYRWDPREDATTLEKITRARDKDAQARRGDLKVEIADHGLVPNEWQCPSVTSWATLFRELWETDRAEFFARRHFLIARIPLNRIKGALVNVGTRVRLTNPWPVNPAGTAATSTGYGITDACGICIGQKYNPREKDYEVDVLVFAGQFDGWRVWMPLGKISSTSGATLTLHADVFDQGNAINDAERFGVPSWSTVATNAVVRIASFDRNSWTLSGTYTVASVSGNSVTLTGAPSAADVLRDRDLWLFVAEDASNLTTWANAYGSPIVLDTLVGGHKLEP